MTSLWPFYQWGMYIIGKFPLVSCQLKFLILGVHYFTKWIQVEVVTKITAERVLRFYWQKIICRYRLPRAIVSENGILFANSIVTDFCKDSELK